MRKLKTTAPQKCDNCQGEFKVSQVRYFREKYTVCLDCIDSIICEHIRSIEILYEDLEN